MENDQGIVVDLYVPRKCEWNRYSASAIDGGQCYESRLTTIQTGSATNRLITSKDHSSVQINICDVDESGKIVQGKNTSYALSGYVRSLGEADDSLNMLATQDGRTFILVSPVSFPLGSFAIANTD